MFISRSKVKARCGSVTEGISLSRIQQVAFPFIKLKQNCLITAGYEPHIHTTTNYKHTDNPNQNQCYAFNSGWYFHQMSMAWYINLQMYACVCVYVHVLNESSPDGSLLRVWDKRRGSRDRQKVREIYNAGKYH